MGWYDVNPIAVRGPRKRKERAPSTSQLRKRREAAQRVPIRRGGHIQLKNLPLAWTLGRRVFWKVDARRVAIGALSPKGMLHMGRYHSSRLRR